MLPPRVKTTDDIQKAMDRVKAIPPAQRKNYYAALQRQVRALTLTKHIPTKEGQQVLAQIRVALGPGNAPLIQMTGKRQHG